MSSFQCTELSTVYFTKEFPPEFEIEWKGYLETCDPAGFIYQLLDDVDSRKLIPYDRCLSLGKQNVELKYTNLWHHYFAYPSTEGLLQAFVLIQPPGSDFVLPHVKKQDKFVDRRENILIREESKPSLKDAFPFSVIPTFVERFQRQFDIQVAQIGTINRERFSIYLTNLESYRNWSIVADYCKPISPPIPDQMAQVEIEYKGRSGVSPKDRIAQTQVLDELSSLAALLQQNSGDGILIPTADTKFDWLIRRL